MRAAHRRSAARALQLLSLAACVACAAPPASTPAAAPPRAIALLEAASEGYATLQHIADSLTIAADTASGEAAQSAARNVVRPTKV